MNKTEFIHSLFLRHREYQECGLEGLQDRSRRPYRHANQLPLQVERAILQLKQEYPTWGAPKIREKLIRRYPQIHPPATSTIHTVLDKNGLVKKQKSRRYRAQRTELQTATSPNQLWCANSFWITFLQWQLYFNLPQTKESLQGLNKSVMKEWLKWVVKVVKTATNLKLKTPFPIKKELNF